MKNGRSYMCLALCSTLLSARATGAQASRLAQHFTFGPRVDLEEPKGVLNVAVAASNDARGGVLVVDARESQVRRYDLNGRLLMYFGRAGGGPGEFPGPPLAAIRLPDNRIAVGDAEGGISVFSASGTIVRRVRVSPSPIYSMVAIGQTIFVSTQRMVHGRLLLLHRWGPESDSLAGSFFEPPVVRNASRRIVATTGGAFVAARADTLVVTFSLADSLYLFPGTAQVPIKRPLSLRSFSYHVGEAPNSGPLSPEFRSWLQTGARVERAFSSSDGALYVQYLRFGSYGPDWHLARLSPSGTVTMDTETGAQLLFVSPMGLVFTDPVTGSPSVWQVASPRVRP